MCSDVKGAQCTFRDLQRAITLKLDDACAAALVVIETLKATLLAKT